MKNNQTRVQCLRRDERERVIAGRGWHMVKKDQDAPKEICWKPSEVIQAQKVHTLTFKNAGEYRITYELIHDGSPIDFEKIEMSLVRDKVMRFSK